LKKRSEAFIGRVGRTVRRPWVWIPGAFLLATGVGFAMGAWQNLCSDCPSVAQIHTWEPQQTSKVFSHDGRLLGELGIERRTPVAIEALPPHVPQAFLAIEDRRFYRHWGLDVRGFTRAALGVVTSGSFRGGGGSTITQQLARNMFESIGFERRGLGGILRKLKELQVALELERAYSKDQILEAYMNQVNYDRGWYGIQTASRNYFGKNADELNPAEAAMLAAVVNRPAFYNPLRNPENGRQRRNLVLDRMAREGFLTREEAEGWMQHPLPESGAQLAGDVAPYFVEWVRQEMQSRFGNQLYTAGLQIYTTLDMEMQAAAETAMKRGFERIEARPGFSHPRYTEYMAGDPGEQTNTLYVQGTFIALDPQTGAVKAMIGGRDFLNSRFDRARQARRQPGSSFKTFVYAAALEAGIPASHVIADNAVVLPQGPGLPEWAPQNFDREFMGDMTLREAFRLSRNTVAVKLGQEVGLETVAQAARRYGIRTDIPRVPSMPIGAADVIPLQMAEAYSSFAALGTKVRPYPILRVLSSEGTVIWEPQPERTQVMDPVAARAMVSLMEDVVTRGTGATAIRVIAGLPATVPAAGKTGTTNNFADAWFVGFTPTLQAAVWFGMDQPQAIHPNATGGGDAAPVWGEFMRQVYVGDLFPDESSDNGEESRPLLPIPDAWPLDGLVSLQVDDRTGLLASQWCPASRRYTEHFVPGTEPTELCDASNEGPAIRWPW